MLIEVENDLLSVEDHAIIVHGCNCQSKYQSGIAGQIRKKYPQAYDSYMAYKPKRLGEIDVVDFFPKDFYIFNAFTQVYYGRDGNRYAEPLAIEAVLLKTIQFNRYFHGSRDGRTLLPIHVPRIGCGLGGLDWEKDVKPIYLQVLDFIGNKHLDLVVHYVA